MAEKRTRGDDDYAAAFLSTAVEKKNKRVKTNGDDNGNNTDATNEQETLPQSSNHFLNGNFGPVKNEVSQQSIPVIFGELPKDIDGVFMRNGPNPLFLPIENHHWFEGDGMVHAVNISNGRADYRNRWVETEDFLYEKNLGSKYFYSLLDFKQHKLSLLPSFLWNFVKENTGMGKNAFAKKDVANTAFVYHDNNLFALVESYLPTVIEAEKLDTIGAYDYGGKLKHAMTAHPKIDVTTNELFFFAYDIFKKPYLQYSWVSSTGELAPSVPIEIEFPTMIHDFVVTQRYAVFPIFPFHIGLNSYFDKNGKSKFGVLDRYASDASSLIWFEFEACYVFHFANAWEEGDEIVVVGCARNTIELELLQNRTQVEYSLVEWRLNTKTKEGVERRRIEKDGTLEFPTINNDYATRKASYMYVVRQFPEDGGKSPESFNGVSKLDFDTNEVNTLRMPEGLYNGEFVYAAREGATEEDDGYLISFGFDSKTEKGEVIFVDAKKMQIVCRAQTPQRVPYGFHGYWLTRAQVRNQRCISAASETANSNE
eukprot:TRINITY_DN6082_c0_g1_i1.p1 TRINITY_DN6082_c0_g1~~TRINITY_DN6082_c0_g1_i1.p1  ORF type:complete len:539 (-),score=141.64 TRINITY_DN6082_c0_g1_i1:216-1832(-)